MRKRFEPQLQIGQRPIEQTPLPKKNRDGMTHLVLALRTLYSLPQYRDQVLNILEDKILCGKNKTGCFGMNLWQIFVLSQVRLCGNMSYDQLHNTVNYHSQIRQLIGVEREWGFERIEFGYQTVIDNVSLLDDQTVRKLNDLIVEFGHKEVFKKKETEALNLKTDSFVVESNVHFPTDYNLLWDCIRKCLSGVDYFLEKYEIPGWRKNKDWYQRLKNQSRTLGKVCASGGPNKEDRVRTIATDYVHTATLLRVKLQKATVNFPLTEMPDVAHMILLENYLLLMEKHIDLVERRLLKGETIPHHQKMFSIFETYTEWLTKGKRRPSVELGKNVSITTDRWHLIVDYQIMENQTDSQIVLEIADRVIARMKVASWSFDRGYWNADNKAILQTEIPRVVMPKKGNCSQQQAIEQNDPVYKKLKNKHNAVESNINALEARGLDRCPDKGYAHFKRYVGIAVCAYNLCCIGRQLATKQPKTHLKAAA